MQKRTKIRVYRVLICLLFVFIFGKKNVYASILESGNGTAEQPYEIHTVEDLCEFRDLVNKGEEFTGQYVNQMEDIDLQSIENWQPIGVIEGEYHFKGIYNGQGYVIHNLQIQSGGNVGLFGALAGTVMNLGIESGYIEGDCVGSITSHSASGSEKIRIINCYNKATLKGYTRAGGIADNFNGGEIYSCWNEGKVDANIKAGICSYNASKIQNSFCLIDPVNYDSFSGKFNRVYTLTGKKNQKDLVERLNTGLYSTEKAVDLNVALVPYIKSDNRIKHVSQVKQQLGEGDGSRENPFLIKTAEDLVKLAEQINQGQLLSGLCFKQVGNLDCSNVKDWKAMGDSAKHFVFDGEYDGAGFQIQNLKCENEKASVFDSVSGRILNLEIQNGEFQGKTASGISLRLEKKGEILNCHTNVQFIADETAGICLNNNGGAIFACWSISKNQIGVISDICLQGTGKIAYCWGKSLVGQNYSGTFWKNIQDDKNEPKLFWLNQNLSKIQLRDEYRAVKFQKLEQEGANIVFSKQKIGAWDKNIAKLINAVPGACVLVLLVGMLLILFRSYKKQKKTFDIKRTIANIGMEEYFIFFMSCGLFFTVYEIFRTHGGIISNIFFSDTLDTGMDFFHSIEYTKGATPYEKYSTLYPPLANLFFYILYCCVPEWQSRNWADSFGASIGMRGTGADLRVWQATLLSFIIYCIVVTMLFLFLSFVLLKGKKYVCMMIFCMMMSNGVLLAFERGNIIFVAMIFTMFFVFFRNSENWFVKEMAFIALGLAFGLKLYPAVVGILLLYDKKIKEAVRAAIYGIAVYVLPIYVFHEGAEGLFNSIQSASGHGVAAASSIKISGASFLGVVGAVIKYICKIIGITCNETVVSGILSKAGIVIFVLILCGGFFLKKEWQRVLVVFLVLLQFRELGGYMIAFMLIPLVAMIREEKLNYDTVLPYTAIIFINILLPVQNIKSDNLSMYWVHIQISFLLLTLYALMQIMNCVKVKYKDIKRNMN